MAKNADLSSKRLISLAPEGWARWVTADPTLEVMELLSGEFQWVGRDSDALIKVRHPQRGEIIVLTEVQLRYQSRMPQRMRAYPALAEEKYGLPVFPVLINLLQVSENPTIPDRYESELLGLHSRQDYRVINLWEVPVEQVFERELLPLLPFTPLMAGGDTEACLEKAARQLRADERLQELESMLALFASFVLEQQIVQRILRWDMAMLENSPLAMELMRRGEQKGELTVLTRQLTRRCGTLSPSLLARVQALSLEQLEELGDALLDFSGVTDLETWLAR